MLHIAICDDDRECVCKIAELLLEYSKDGRNEIITTDFYDGNDLIRSSEKFDAVFLDIEMKYSNGIEIAKRIREKDMTIPIIYITNYSDYWRRAFTVHAFEFIIKPIDKKEVYSCIEDLVSLLNESEETIFLSTENGMECFKLSDIYYFIFEAKKKVYAYTSKGRIVIKKNLSDIYDILDKNRFYQTRRDCIVNLKHIKRIQNEYVIIMTDGSLLPLAQKKKDEFMKKLSTELVKDLKGRKI